MHFFFQVIYENVALNWAKYRSLGNLTNDLVTLLFPIFLTSFQSMGKSVCFLRAFGEGPCQKLWKFKYIFSTGSLCQYISWHSQRIPADWDKISVFKTHADSSSTHHIHVTPTFTFLIHSVILPERDVETHWSVSLRSSPELLLRMGCQPTSLLAQRLCCNNRLPNTVNSFTVPHLSSALDKCCLILGIGNI